jgi:hypothetical protein
MNGYEAAFRGAMGAYGKLAVNGRRWLLHVTGTGGDSEAHYWPNDCEVCKEIARFVDEWKPEAAQHSIKADGASALPESIQEALNSGDGTYRP